MPAVTAVTTPFEAAEKALETNYCYFVVIKPKSFFLLLVVTAESSLALVTRSLAAVGLLCSCSLSEIPPSGFAGETSDRRC